MLANHGQDDQDEHADQGQQDRGPQYSRHQQEERFRELVAN